MIYVFSVWNLHHSSPKAILTPGTFGIIVSKLKAFLPAHDGLFGHMWSGNCTRMRTQQAKQDHQEKVVVGQSRASPWSRSKSKQANYGIQNTTGQSGIQPLRGAVKLVLTHPPGLRADGETYFIPSQALTCQLGIDRRRGRCEMAQQANRKKHDFTDKSISLPCLLRQRRRSH